MTYGSCRFLIQIIVMSRIWSHDSMPKKLPG